MEGKFLQTSAIWRYTITMQTGGQNHMPIHKDEETESLGAAVLSLLAGLVFLAELGVILLLLQA